MKVNIIHTANVYMQKSVLSIFFSNWFFVLLSR